MNKQTSAPCRKRNGKQVSFDFKLSVIAEINNGLISANFASKKYNVSRSTLAYWLKKLSSFEQTNKAMSKNDELKKLKERITELEFIKDLQQDIIADFEITTGKDLSKKSLPEALANEIAKKKKSLTK